MKSNVGNSDFEGFLRAFVITLVALCGASAAYILANSDDLPPPRLSESESFDFKAHWLRGAIADGRCGVLIIGSSMALNNFYNPVFAQTIQEKVVNLGSFGAGVKETDRVLASTVSLCNPRLVIYPIYHGDLNSGGRNIDWNSFAEYISGRPALPIYLKTLDPISMYNGVKRTKKRRPLGRRVYHSLEFDASGTVNLSVEDFAVDKKRWDGYRYARYSPASQGTLIALSHILEMGKEKGFRVVIATIPMREAAEQHVGQTALDNIWRQVGDAVAEGGGKFVRIDNEQRFPDSMFADYTHLNERGAAVWTQIMLEQSREVIARVLDRPRV